MAILTIYFKVFPFKVECNICGWRDNQFKSDSWHLYTICPKCRSHVRQRLFWASINCLPEVSVTKVLQGKRILHFAPHKCLVKRMVNKVGQYTTADIRAGESIDLNIDISNMNHVKDQEFDCIIAFDVLEHVPNHLKAIEESNRIICDGGYCIFMVPQKDNLENTYEDLAITDPKDREEKFGQSDHWRIYGNDFKKMIEDRGFEVTVINEQDIDKKLVEKHVLFPPVLSTHQLATNYRRIYFGKKIKHITQNIII